MKLITTGDIEKKFGISKFRVKDLAKRGLLKCVKTAGNQYRFREEDVDKYFAEWLSTLDESSAEATLSEKVEEQG